MTPPDNASNREGTVRYEPYRTVEAVGRWIGLMTCRDCGATVMLDEASDAAAIHDRGGET